MLRRIQSKRSFRKTASSPSHALVRSNQCARPPPILARRNSSGGRRFHAGNPQYYGFSSTGNLACATTRKLRPPQNAPQNSIEAFFPLSRLYFRFNASSSSNARGQSAPNNRDKLRSAKTFPPVWHRAQ